MSSYDVVIIGGGPGATTPPSAPGNWASRWPVSRAAKPSAAPA